MNRLIGLLRAMGVKVVQLSSDTYSFESVDVDFDYLQTDDFIKQANRLRGSIMILGPFVGKI